MARRKQLWNIGDVFAIELNDHKFVVGQVVGHEVDALNSVSAAFFDSRFDSLPGAQAIQELNVEKIFSVLFVTPDLLGTGRWKIIGNHAVNIPKNWMPYEHLRSKRFVGADVFGSAIVEEFLNAYYALVPWDDWKDPNYLDGLLISANKKPAHLLYKSKS